MTPITTAQQIYLALGVREEKLFFGHKIGKTESNTKKGPGRKHVEGRSAKGSTPR